MQIKMLFYVNKFARLQPSRHCSAVCVLERFNTQPPEGGCRLLSATGGVSVKFQHTATRRWLRQGENLSRVEMLFQHTATRRWLRFMRSFLMTATLFQHTATRRWLRFKLPDKNFCGYSFNTQPPEGGCPARAALDPFNFQVSTHSHPKVAA